VAVVDDDEGEAGDDVVVALAPVVEVVGDTVVGGAVVVDAVDSRPEVLSTRPAVSTGVGPNEPA
jgi:hypothetical protein